MATIESPDEQANRMITALRQLNRLDPGGAYWRYAAYVSGVVVLAAVGGYASAMLLTASDANYLGAVYAGILTCLTMLFLKPRAAKHPYREIAAAGAAILLGAGIGGAVGHIPVLSQGLAVVFAFAGFYVRRWPEPLPMAGFVMALCFVISQILAPFAPRGVVHAAMLPLLIFVSLGFWFLPRSAFTRAFVLCVQRMRATLPDEVKTPSTDRDAVRASIRRVDTRLAQVNAARVQADQYDPTNASQHLTLVHSAATVARVWENAADSLYRVAQDDPSEQTGAQAACRDAKVAVSAALTESTDANRAAAETALSGIDTMVDSVVASLDGSDRLPDGAEAVPFHLINSELALSHMLEAVAQLDAELARQTGTRKTETG